MNGNSTELKVILYSIVVLLALPQFLKTTEKKGNA